ncbi:acyl-CoA synthetase [Streptomyces sp. NPDC005438]|uniref:acyl-CoA synthetase n=1 Tax=Streptomyces sp. NPDC005438 TaxID=3156880 RepID=UPI0033B68CC9
MSELIPSLAPGHPAASTEALRFGERRLTHGQLASAAGGLAARLRGAERVAVWATPTLETALAVVACLVAGVPAVPVNPRVGARELEHIVADSAPSLVLAAEGDELPEGLAALPRVTVTVDSEADPGGEPAGPVPEHPAEAAALIVYTSGTTGPPKGVLLPRRAVANCLDALAVAWGWTDQDQLVHALPLFHVHGLVLGILGPLRHGSRVWHLGRFSPAAVAEALSAGGTMLFGVPTMYHRLAEAADEEPGVAEALRRARLLVSGSAALPRPVHQRIQRATGQWVIERYGMTETLMNTSVRLSGPHRPGTVGTPLDGVEIRLVEEDGSVIDSWDGRTVGEVQVRGNQLFTGYLNRPETTASSFDGDWFRTGDMGVRDEDGQLRLVGRKSTDLIKSGGYKIGAGEIENVLLDHPEVAEAAVTGEPDEDLGERIVAWIVPRDPGQPPGQEELADHVARELAPHKRPRRVRLREGLPRNDMGKVLKRELS